MELPIKLKALYRHWALHVRKENRGAFALEGSVRSILEEIKWFVVERIAVWKRKERGDGPPYTTDPILGRYRFCNIFREFDRQTIEFHTMLHPLRVNFPLWLLNMFYCRMVARPETVQKAGFLSFDKEHNRGVYEKLIRMPRPRFGTPYVFPISAIQHGPTPTRELFMTKWLPKVIPAIAEEIRTWERASVYEGVQKILPLFGCNLPFLWTETLIDVAYQFPERIDLFGRFPAGPGALPTLQRIDPDRDPSMLTVELCSIGIDTGLTFEHKPLRLSAENWEGIGCEYRKYVNLRAGKGRKRIYSSA